MRFEEGILEWLVPTIKAQSSKNQRTYLDFVPKALDNRVAEGEIRYKSTIHNVQMQIVGTIVQKPLRFLVQLGQIRVQNRWPNLGAEGRHRGNVSWISV